MAVPANPTKPTLSNDQHNAHALGVSLSEADVLLDRYRRLMAHSFPFVVLTPNVTAQNMCEEKPLLLHSIVTVAYWHDYPRQKAMLKGLLRDINERVVINNEKSLGALQAIEVLAAWYHAHMFHAPQLTTLLHTAMALAIDLGIDQPRRAFGSEARPGDTPFSRSGRTLTLDEHRALAGLFHLTLIMGSCRGKIFNVPTPSTKLMEDTLRALEGARENECDLRMVQMIRLQCLIEETMGIQNSGTPPQMYVCGSVSYPLHSVLGQGRATLLTPLDFWSDDRHHFEQKPPW